MMRTFIGKLLRGMSNALFSGKCLSCGRLFNPGTAAPRRFEAALNGPAAVFHTEMANHFCGRCRIQWTAVIPPLCWRCGLVFKSRVGRNHLCGHCLDRPGAFNRARAFGVYDQSLKIAIHALKFKGRAHLAGPLGNLLYHTYRQHWQPAEIDMVAPVPLHWRRFRQRGFNQAYLLVRRWRLPDQTVIVRDLLTRIRATAPQTGLDRRQRRMNIKNAFVMSRAGESAGKRVLLVDDVLTTGATAESCAEALMDDGAEQVDVLTLARAL